MNTEYEAGAQILHIEDNDADFEAVTHLLKKSGANVPVLRCTSGDDALDYLYQRGIWAKWSPRPSLVILDLNLPGTDGRVVLEIIKTDDNLKSIPVLVLTSSPRQPDINDSYRAGANSYFLKPDSLLELEDLIDVIRRYWINKFIAIEGRVES